MNYYDYKKELAGYVIEADKGDVQAAYRASALFAMIERDDANHYKYAKLAVENACDEDKKLKAYHEALNILGACYQYGQGCEKDLKRAFEIYLESSELGNDESQMQLGSFYLGGFGGIEKNYDEGMRWLEKSAAAGNDKGKEYYEYAKMLRDGLINDFTMLQAEDQELPPYMNLVQIEKSFNSMGHYFRELDAVVKSARDNISYDTIHAAKTLALHGMAFFFEKRDIDNVELIYQMISIFIDEKLQVSVDYCMMDWTMLDNYGVLKVAAKEQDGFEYLERAVKAIEKAYELIEKKELLKMPLIDYYNRVGTLYGSVGDMKNHSKYLGLAYKLNADEEGDK